MRKRQGGKKEGENGLRGGTRDTHAERKGARAREGDSFGGGREGGTREKERGSLMDEGKGKGPGKTPKQIRVPPLTDRKFVEVRPRDKPRGRRRTIGCLIGRSGTRPIVP